MRKRLHNWLSEMAYVVDIQGFKSMSNQFIIKEICILGIDNNESFHRIVKPLTCYRRLSVELQRRVDWVTRYIHGLPWDLPGCMDHSEIEFMTRKILRKANRVYIKGSERVSFLKELLDYPDINIVDLDIFDYHGSRQLTDEYRGHNCSRYPVRHNQLRCAVKKALTYRDYLLKHLERRE